MTNNEEYAFALFASISLAQSKRIQNLVVCRESMMVIRVVVKGNIIGGNLYSGVMSRSLDALKNFDKHIMYQAKR
jgi:hypothetical protein